MKHDFVRDAGQVRLLRLYAIVMACQQCVIRCTSKMQLFNEICHHIVETGELKAAWIGLMDDGDTKVWAQAYFGDGLNYLESIELTMNDSPAKESEPVSMAIQQNMPIWSQAIETDPVMQAWQERSQSRGWHSAAVIPLRQSGEPVGVLVLYASEPHAFDDLTRTLLTQLASSISYALDFFEQNIQRQQAEYAMLESEVRYNALFASSCMPMLLIEPGKGGIVDANILAINFYGWSQDTLKSMNISDINVLSPDQIKREIALSANNRKSYLDFRHRLANGQERDVEVFSSPVSFGGQTYLMLAIHDVTERRRAESRVHLAQTLTQRFIDQLPGVAFVKDSQLRLVMVNQNLGSMLGMEAQTLIGKTAYDLFPKDFADTLTQNDKQMLEQGGSRIFEAAYNGRRSETSMFVIDDGFGEHFVCGLSLDMTERDLQSQRVKALLRVNEIGGQLSEKEFLTQGLELAESLTQSQIGFLHFVNDDQETLEFVAWTAGTLKGCTAQFDAHYPIKQAGIWADSARKGEAVIFNDYHSYSALHGLPEGHVPLTRLISVPVIEDGKVRLVMGVGNKSTNYSSSDVDNLRLLGNDMWRIVRRVRADKALQLRVDELVTVNKNLADTQVQLLQSEKMASIGQLAAGVAHEINNPIGFVKSNLGSLAQYVDKLLDVTNAYELAQHALGESCSNAFADVQRAKQAADYAYLVSDLPALINESRDGVDRVSKIVMDLKNFSRVGDTAFQWADLHVGLESTINVVWNELKYKAEVVREYGELPQVLCVAPQINQVVMNLLVNAAQSIAEHGRITVRTGCEGDHVWIEVQDTGCGIPPEKQAHIFEPFYTTKPAGQGTGLGLSIAFGIVKQHHGSLTFCSQLGEGSTFRLTLPVNGKNMQAKPIEIGITGANQS